MTEQEKQDLKYELNDLLASYRYNVEDVAILGVKIARLEDKLAEMRETHKKIIEKANKFRTEIEGIQDRLLREVPTQGPYYALHSQEFQKMLPDICDRVQGRNNRINFIKEIRTLTGAGIKEAKDAMDAYLNMGVQPGNF
jgi:ribosomal protein L7/L12